LLQHTVTGGGKYDSYCLCENSTYTSRVITDSYNYVAPSESLYEEWYVYGLDTNLSVERLFSDYIKVQGDGYALVTTRVGNTAGTGAVIKVYDRCETEDTNDDVLVEQFYIIIFGDVNGDSVVTHDGTLTFRGVADREWAANTGGTPHLKKAASVDGNSRVTINDATLIEGVKEGTKTLSQITGIAE
jgi:hypothetical protein